MKSKAERWEEIKDLKASDVIIHKAFAMYDSEDLEDQTDVLMHIVLEQLEKIKALELTNQNLIADKYSRKQPMGDVK